MIYRQEGYVLKEIEGVSVLLPVGQAVADQKKAVTLNETGVFLWKMLHIGRSKEELTRALVRQYETEGIKKEEIQKDAEEFTEQMLAMGIFREELRRTNEPFYGFMKIADLSVNLYGKKTFFSECFTPFLAEEGKTPDMELEIINAVPKSRQNGTILLQNREMTICKREDGYVVRFPTMENIVEAYMTENGEYARIYCLFLSDMQKERENLFHAVRLFFLYRAQRSGYTAIHSASICYRRKAWLFAGHSGCGKSTHTALWKKWVGTPYLNGDLNLVGRDETGRWNVYGIPWCGTSGISTVETVELGGIVLLEQAKEDQVKPLSGYEKVLRVMQRMISPAWTEELLDRNLKIAEKLAKEIPVYHLQCTKNPSAVDVIREQMDDPEV